jgi:hypothetical protein
MSTGTKEDESRTGRIWATGFHHVTARSRLRAFIYLIFQFFSVRGKKRITETAVTESVDTGARLYLFF